MTKFQLSRVINVTVFFFIVSMPKFHSNIPSSIFYETVMFKILRIARSFSSVVSFYEKTSAHVTRIKKQAWIRGKQLKSFEGIKKSTAFLPEVWYINWDFLGTFPKHSFLGYSREVEIIIFLSLGIDAPTYDLS